MQHDPVRLAPRAEKRRPSPAAYLWAVLVFATMGAGVAWAAVHIRLESSIPSADEVLSEAPERFELRFSGPVSEALSVLVLVGPAGDSVQVSLRRPGDDERILVGDFPTTMNGDYIVRWRTVSADGHPVAGEFGFILARALVTGNSEAVEPGRGETRNEALAPGAARLAEEESADDTPAAVAGEETPPLGAVLLAGLGMACLLGFTGLLWFCGSLPLLQEPRIGRATLALGSLALFLLAIDLVGWMMAVVPRGAGVNGFAAAIGSTTGAIRLAGLGLLATAIIVLRRHGRAAAALAFTAVVIGAASGHAAAISPWITFPAKAVHLAAVSIWFGGLLLLVLAPDGPADGSDTWRFGGVVQSVSTGALLAVVLVAASGMVQSALFVGDLAAYTGTAYGRGVLAKWGGLMLLIGFGAYHRFRVMPALDEGGDDRKMRRTVRLETIVMLAVVMLAAWLAQVSPPVAY